MLRDTEPCQIQFQKRFSLPCGKCGPEPLGRDLCGAVFPGCHYSVDSQETLNILFGVKSLLHERNGAFYGSMIDFSFLS